MKFHITNPHVLHFVSRYTMQINRMQYKMCIYVIYTHTHRRDGRIPHRCSIAMYRKHFSYNEIHSSIQLERNALNQNALPSPHRTIQ